MRTRCRANIPASPTSPRCRTMSARAATPSCCAAAPIMRCSTASSSSPAACLDIDETGGTTTRAADDAAAGSRPAGLPLGPAGLPDRLPQRRQRHHGAGRRDLRHRHQQQQRRPRLDADRHRALHQRRQRDRGGGDRSDAVQRRSRSPRSNAAAPNRLTAVTYIGAVQRRGRHLVRGLDLQFGLREFRRRQRHLHRRPDLLIAAAIHRADSDSIDGGRR